MECYLVIFANMACLFIDGFFGGSKLFFMVKMYIHTINDHPRLPMKPKILGAIKWCFEKLFYGKNVHSYYK